MDVLRVSATSPARALAGALVVTWIVLLHWR